MLVLALDTSSLSLSAALCELARGADGRWSQRVLAEVVRSPPERHGDVLPAALLDLCAAAGKSLSDVTGLAVGIGPGSFTGLRVGLASAKAIAYARKLPLAAASSLRALTRGAERVASAADARAFAGRLLVPTLEARKAELYAEAYALPDRAGRGGEDAADPRGASQEAVADLQVLRAEAAYRSPQLVAALRDLPGTPLLFGPGQAACAAELRAAGAPEEWFLVPEGPAGCASGQPTAASLPSLPLAADVAWLCADALEGAAFDEARVFALAPNYVKPSEAEVALSEGRVGGLPQPK